MTQAKVPIYNPCTDYKSVEQMVGAALKPFGKGLVDFGDSFIESLYGTVALPFRIPTVIRRDHNDQSLLGRKPWVSFNLGGYFGAMIGTIAGLVIDVGLGMYSGIEATNGNYIPLIALGTTNLASGIYETGRREKNRLEHLGVLKFRDWERKNEEKVAEKEEKEK